jgi:hypothetical protein
MASSAGTGGVFFVAAAGFFTGLAGAGGTIASSAAGAFFLGGMTFSFTKGLNKSITVYDFQAEMLQGR